jgi:hypothetical protein
MWYNVPFDYDDSFENYELMQKNAVYDLSMIKHLIQLFFI